MATIQDPDPVRFGLYFTALTSPSIPRMLLTEVSVVFHSAATIRFDEKLTEAVKLNVVAVQTILELAKRMKKLEVLGLC